MRLAFATTTSSSTSSHLTLVLGCLFMTMAVVSNQAAAQQAPAGCTAANVFTQCLQNEQDYLKTCKDQDFACLCKWNTAKLSCWDNCPNDPARATQAGLVSNYCAIAGANAPTAFQAALFVRNWEFVPFFDAGGVL
ncbi:hypothetical protein BDB00DRAFT_783016 [Zychaea mexicana]|uniref:uncharacterized protein n=1 Tax=Zychaea mexicana TaxID=64656 RepID=UPI0022FE0348|nr:uncharacterized protein BDB00DRAFT_783016 [Zychaea mexicana]KAI9499515.1 hypothetical protein BDB00DRAFT_783016 [Zychaea mexicana]